MSEIGSSGSNLLLTSEAAAYLRLPANTLQFWRSQGRGPRWAKLGRRVVYARQDLDHFVDLSQVSPR